MTNPAADTPCHCRPVPFGCHGVDRGQWAFGKAIAAEVSVYVFVLFRFAAASAALALLARNEPGPRLAEMTAGQWRDLTLMALLGLVGDV